MSRRWIGATLVTLSLVAQAAAQTPIPGGHGPPMPAYQPTFAGDPMPVSGAQFCPPPGGISPNAVQDSAFSLPNDGSPNGFSEDCTNCGEGTGMYAYVGWMALLRYSMGNGLLAVRDPGVAIPGIPQNVDSGILPPRNTPRLQGFNDVSPNFVNGVRATIGWREGMHAVELCGFYLPPRNSFNVLVDRGQLDLPFAAFPSPIGFQGDNFLWLQADQVRFSLETTLASAELNYRCITGIGFDWLIGFRYFDLQERFGILTDDDGLVAPDPVNPALIANYNSRVHNRILAGQVGFECNVRLLSCLALTGTAKGAWGVNIMNSENKLERGDGFPGPRATRDASFFSHLYEVGLYGDLALNEHIRIRAGYNLLFVVNVSEAHEQVNFDLGNIGGTTKDDGFIFYHGPMLEFQFFF